MMSSTYFIWFLLLPFIAHSLSVCDELDITFLATPDSIINSVDNMKSIMQQVISDGTSDSTDYNLMLYGDNVPASFQNTIIPIYNPSVLQDIQTQLQQNADSSSSSTKISASDAIRLYKQHQAKPLKPYLKQQRFKEFADHNYTETQYIVFTDERSTIECDEVDDELNIILKHNVSVAADDNLSGECRMNIFYEHDLIHKKTEILRLHSITCSAKVLDDDRNEILLNHHAQFVDPDSYILCDIGSHKSYVYMFYDDDYAKYKRNDYFIVTRDVINDLPDSCKSTLVYKVVNVSIISVQDLELETIASLDSKQAKQLNDSTKILKLSIKFPETFHEYIFKADIKKDQKIEPEEQERNRRLFINVGPKDKPIFNFHFTHSDSYSPLNVDIRYNAEFSLDINYYFELHWDIFTKNHLFEFRVYGGYAAGFSFEVSVTEQISIPLGDFLNFNGRTHIIWIGIIPIWLKPYLKASLELIVLLPFEISGSLTCDYAATYNKGYKYTNSIMTPGYGLIGENIYFDVSSIVRDFGTGYTLETCAQSNYKYNKCEFWAFRPSNGSCHCIDLNHDEDIIQKEGWHLYKMGASCEKPKTSCESGCGINGIRTQFFELDSYESPSCSCWWPWVCKMRTCVACKRFGGDDIWNITNITEEKIHEEEITSKECTKHLSLDWKNNDMCDTLKYNEDIGFDVVIEPSIGVKLYSIINIYLRAPITNEFRIQPIETDPAVCGLSASHDMCSPNSNTVYVSLALHSYLSLYFGAKIELPEILSKAIDTLTEDTNTSYDQSGSDSFQLFEITILSDKKLLSHHFKPCLQMIELLPPLNAYLLGRCCGNTAATTTTTAPITTISATTTTAQSGNCTVPNPEYIGDGWCDTGAYNTEACLYDGGDCCKETCHNGTYICGSNGYNCTDPHVTYGWNVFSLKWGANTTYAVQANGCDVPYPLFLGDGRCDEGDYNAAACYYDFGDCCEATCVNSTHICGSNGYDCRNPIITSGWHYFNMLYGPDVTNAFLANGCTVSWAPYIHDGMCDHGDYNTPQCAYDGGDCCPSTCVNSTYICGSNGYNCTDPGQWHGCNVTNTHYLRDGYCDRGDYNTPECRYDGGDCCEETCQDSYYICGHNGFQCMDPLFATNATVCNVDYPEYIGDGYCDYGAYNTEACGYDGGDCCRETCQNTTTITCGINGFECLDPAIIFSTTSDVFTTTEDYLVACTADELEYIGDGWCDWDLAGYNIKSCDYDGGDCCEETCHDAEYSCGSNGYHCINPIHLIKECNVSSLHYINDGWCDYNGIHNTEQCLYDGGDCCEETCQNTSYICGSNGYNCTDPRVLYGWNAFYLEWGANLTWELLDNGCDAQYPLFLGDGRCDEGNEGYYNTHACHYDGGDCCEATCENSTYICGSNGYNCGDPFVASGWYSFYIQHGENITKTLLNNMCNVSVPLLIGDGFCNMDSNYNTEACLYDLGDCCETTCVDNAHMCGSNGYSCVDPDALADITTTSDTITTLGTSTTTEASTTDYTITTADTTTNSLISTSIINTTSSVTTDAADKTTTDGTITTADAITTANEITTADTIIASEETTADDTIATGDTMTTADATTNSWSSTVGAMSSTDDSDVDPAADTTDESSGCNVANPSFIGNGRCDDYDAYNTDQCNYDGGDCCEETCNDSGSKLSTSIFQCGSSGYHCIDPSVQMDEGDDDDDNPSGNAAFQFSANVGFVVTIISFVYFS